MKKLKNSFLQHSLLDTVNKPHLKKSHLGWVIVGVMTVGSATAVLSTVDVNTVDAVKSAVIKNNNYNVDVLNDDTNHSFLDTIGYINSLKQEYSHSKFRSVVSSTTYYAIDLINEGIISDCHVTWNDSTAVPDKKISEFQKDGAIYPKSYSFKINKNNLLKNGDTIKYGVKGSGRYGMFRGISNNIEIENLGKIGNSDILLNNYSSDKEFVIKSDAVRVSGDESITDGSKSTTEFNFLGYTAIVNHTVRDFKKISDNDLNSESRYNWGHGIIGNNESGVILSGWYSDYQDADRLTNSKPGETEEDIFGDLPQYTKPTVLGYTVQNSISILQTTLNGYSWYNANNVTNRSIHLPMPDGSGVSNQPYQGTATKRMYNSSATKVSIPNGTTIDDAARMIESIDLGYSEFIDNNGDIAVVFQVPPIKSKKFPRYDEDALNLQIRSFDFKTTPEYINSFKSKMLGKPMVQYAWIGMYLAKNTKMTGETIIGTSYRFFDGQKSEKTSSTKSIGSSIQVGSQSLVKFRFQNKAGKDIATPVIKTGYGLNNTENNPVESYDYTAPSEIKSELDKGIYKLSAGQTANIKGQFQDANDGDKEVIFKYDDPVFRHTIWNSSDANTKNNTGTYGDDMSQGYVLKVDPWQDSIDDSSVTVPEDKRIGVRAKGIFGADKDKGAKWYLDLDGTLHVNSGTLAATSGLKTSPWAKYAKDIKAINFEGNVVLDADSSLLFKDLTSLKKITFKNIDVSKVSAPVQLPGTNDILKWFNGTTILGTSFDNKAKLSNVTLDLKKENKAKIQINVKDSDGNVVGKDLARYIIVDKSNNNTNNDIFGNHTDEYKIVGDFKTNDKGVISTKYLDAGEYEIYRKDVDQRYDAYQTIGIGATPNGKLIGSLKIDKSKDTFNISDELDVRKPVAVKGKNIFEKVGHYKVISSPEFIWSEVTNLEGNPGTRSAKRLDLRNVKPDDIEAAYFVVQHEDSISGQSVVPDAQHLKDYSAMKKYSLDMDIIENGAVIKRINLPGSINNSMSTSSKHADVIGNASFSYSDATDIFKKLAGKNTVFSGSNLKIKDDFGPYAQKDYGFLFIADYYVVLKDSSQPLSLTVINDSHAATLSSKSVADLSIDTSIPEKYEVVPNSNIDAKLLLGSYDTGYDSFEATYLTESSSEKINATVPPAGIWTNASLSTKIKSGNNQKINFKLTNTGGADTMGMLAMQVPIQQIGVHLKYVDQYGHQLKDVSELKAPDGQSVAKDGTVTLDGIAPGVDLPTSGFTNNKYYKFKEVKYDGGATKAPGKGKSINGTVVYESTNNAWSANSDSDTKKNIGTYGDKGLENYVLKADPWRDLIDDTSDTTKLLKVKGKGIFGTVKWYIDEQDTLHLSSGTLAEVDKGDKAYPVSTFSGKGVLKISVDGKVVFPKNSYGLFAHMMSVSDIINSQNFDFGNSEQLVGIFYGMDLKTLDVSSWDLSKAVNIYDFLGGMGNLVELKGIEKWKTPNLQNIHYLLGGSKLETINFGTWDTPMLNDVGSLLGNMYDLKYIDFSNWTLGKNANVYNMFDEATNTKLTKVKFGDKFTIQVKLPNATSTKKWRAVGSGTEAKPNGKWLLDSIYTGNPVDSDTYVLVPYIQNHTITAVDETNDPVKDVEIELIDKDNKVVATVKTNDAGKAVFKDIVIADYTVRQKPKAGFDTASNQTITEKQPDATLHLTTQVDKSQLPATGKNAILALVSVITASLASLLAFFTHRNKKDLDKD